MDNFKIFLLSITDPLVWVVDKKAGSILDLGCGQGKPMAMIKMWRNVKYSEGVDLYRPYINEARKLKIHNKLRMADIRKVTYPHKSFDIVLANQVIEHLEKKEALELIRKMEGWARKEVIISTPIGEMYQPVLDKNIHQEHKSHFFPEEFQKRGYTVIRYGLRFLLDEHSNGLVHRFENPLVKKIIYLVNFFISPFYYLFPQICDYSFVAYKRV